MCFVCAVRTGTVPDGQSRASLGDLPRLYTIAFVRREPDGTRRRSHLRVYLPPDGRGELEPQETEDERASILALNEAAQIIANVTADAFMYATPLVPVVALFDRLLRDGHTWDARPWHSAIDVRTEVGARLGLPVDQRHLPDIAARAGLDLAEFFDGGEAAGCRTRRTAEVWERLFDASRPPSALSAPGTPVQPSAAARSPAAPGPGCGLA